VEANSKKSFTNYHADKAQSTYRHEIFKTDRSFPIIGYSKKIGCVEMIDKDFLLKKTIINLLPRYWENLFSFKVYMRDINGSERLIINFGTDYNDSLQRYAGWISKNITLMHEKQPLESQLPKRETVKNKEASFFDLTKKRFLDEISLQNYCNVLISREGFPHGQVGSFYNKYKSKYLSNN
jgi:hypothetical protein